MSMRHDVVSLSQLLRRNDNSNPRRGGSGYAPPLPLQTSRRRAERMLSSGTNNVEGRNLHSATSTDRPGTSRYQPLFMQSVRDANSTSTSQPESSQTGSGFPVLSSQEAYDAESVQLSAMTSMSQSSLSQAQSQNLLGLSQDDKLQRPQQWQTPQALPSFSTVHCNGSEKLQEVEQSLTKALAEQIQVQKQQQEQLLTQFASPMNKSMEEIKTRLVTCSEGQQKQDAVIRVLEKGIDNVTTITSELREQSRSNKAVCEETRTVVVSEAAAVKAALTSLQARVDSVEGSVRRCSGQVTQVLEVIGAKHKVLLSAIVASSCNCPQDATSVKCLSSVERVIKKRRQNLSQPDERKASGYKSTSVTGLPMQSKVHSPTHNGSLHLALQRIKALQAKRRSYMHDG